MQRLVQTIQALPNLGSIGITIGNFDGVHLGHAYLLEKAQKYCKEAGLELVVVTFVPHPQSILCQNKSAFLINSYLERRELLREKGVLNLIEVPFTPEIGQMSPEVFLETFLNSSAIKKVFWGHDFAFGKNRAGSYSFAQKYFGGKGIQVSLQGPFMGEGEVVSSSRIRECIRTGKMDMAQKLLGRPFYLKGEVSHAKGLGQKMGFPTANLALETEIILPEPGVYCSQVRWKKSLIKSVTNVGTNPTMDSLDQKIKIETHLLDFENDLYGDEIQVEFLQHIRKEQRFNDMSELKEQIAKDVEYSRKYRNMLDAELGIIR